MNVVSIARFEASECIDSFYWAHGPCCAGCDHWMQHNSAVGDCTKSAPASGSERIGMLGFRYHSVAPSAGHVMTKRDHKCGDFSDTFDWGSLSKEYLLRIGFKG